MSELGKQLDDLLAVPAQPVPQQSRRFEFDHAKGEGVLYTPPEPANVEPDYEEHLRILGFDPSAYQIDQSGVRVSVWEVATRDGTQTLRAVRARVVARAPGVGFDSESLLREIARHKPPKRQPQPAENGGCMVVCIADTQAGKADVPPETARFGHANGTEQLVTRFLQTIGNVETRVAELRKTGRPLNSLLIACLGDLVEGCDQNYQSQQWSTELDRREQTRIMRRLLLKAVERWARLFPEVTLAAVAGNHGEHRRNGKQFTNPESNDDLAIPEQVLEILAANPDTYGHVTGAIGGDPYTRVIDAGGHVVGMLHGHMAKESGTAQQKIARWFERQAAAKAPVAAADVVLSGHYHFYSHSESNGAVTFIQAPAMESASLYYSATRGAASNPGTLTFCLYPDRKRIQDLAIL